MCRNKQGVFFVNSWDSGQNCRTNALSHLARYLQTSGAREGHDRPPSMVAENDHCVILHRKKSHWWTDAPRHHHLQPILASMMENADMVVYIAVKSGTPLPKPLQHQLINLSRKHLLESQDLYSITLLSAIMIGHNNVMGYWCLHCSTTIYTDLVLKFLLVKPSICDNALYVLSLSSSEEALIGN